MKGPRGPKSITVVAFPRGRARRGRWSSDIGGGATKGFLLAGGLTSALRVLPCSPGFLACLV